ncbi:hypothetical protein VTI74DRAFT_1517 [Chaetomium olivicolor]
MPLFDSLKEKLSSKKKEGSRSRSPSPNPSLRSQSSHLFPTQTSFFTPPAAPADTKSGLHDPPPPPYSAVAPAVAGPSSAPAPAVPVPTIAINSDPFAPRATSPAPSFSSARSDRSITSPEDPYAFLSSFDTIFVIDDSGSMMGASWRETKEALRAIAPICTAHDADGVDVWFLNHRNPHDKDRTQHGCYRNVRDAARVKQLFRDVRPTGATPTGTRLRHILKPYVDRYESAVRRTGNTDDCGVKPVNIIVITDGAPTDDPEAVIVSAAQKLDKLDAPPHQVGIQFFQVGDLPDAAEALRQLDDELAHSGVRDMVDTVTWSGDSSGRPVLTAEGILKVVLGAVVKRLDRKRSQRTTGTWLRP